MKLGSVSINYNGQVNEVPVSCRQSDKKRGLEIEEELKQLLLDGTFKL